MSLNVAPSGFEPIRLPLDRGVSEHPLVGSPSPLRQAEPCAFAAFGFDAELEARSTLAEPAQSLGGGVMVDAEDPGDGGDRHASLAKLKSLRCHRLIDRRHDRIA